MRHLRYILRPFFVALTISAVHAETVQKTVGSTPLNLPVPPAFCTLDQNNLRDGLFIAVITHLLQGTNKLVMTTADCAVLEKWRGGDNSAIQKYAIYYVPNAVENLTLPGETASLRKGLCDEMRKQGQATMDKAKEIASQRTREMNVDVKINDMTYIGVVDEDEHACYSAILVRGVGTDSKPFAISGIITSTIIQAKPIFLALYNPYEGEQTVQNGVQKSKTIAADFESTNR